MGVNKILKQIKQYITKKRELLIFERIKTDFLKKNVTKRKFR